MTLSSEKQQNPADEIIEDVVAKYAALAASEIWRDYRDDVSSIDEVNYVAYYAILKFMEHLTDGSNQEMLSLLFAITDRRQVYHRNKVDELAQKEHDKK